MQKINKIKTTPSIIIAREAVDRGMRELANGKYDDDYLVGIMYQEGVISEDEYNNLTKNKITRIKEWMRYVS